jgi:hypothetical protein
MRETPRESGRLFQMTGASEKPIGILKENSKGSEIAEEILLGFQEEFGKL